jgi:hypothetical protein
MQQDEPQAFGPSPHDQPSDAPAPKRPARRRSRAKAAEEPPKDLAPILKGWDYESGTINVRKITGLDGLPKIQMRLDLGVLQMELTGRPDGQRPHGHESLLDYFEKQLRDHHQRNGTELGFQLNSEQCEALREEAEMYYRRYLSLFVLGEFSGVVRDTGRNIRVMDLCHQFGATEQDRLIMEQFRPYLVMMHTRAGASVQYKAGQFPEALATVTKGLAQIRDFFNRFGQEEAYAAASEVRLLKKFAREIRRRLPVDPMQRLQRRLDRAVRDERYEDAAKLRDEITGRKQAMEKPR